MLALPAGGAAAPAEGEGGPPEGQPLPQLGFEPGGYDFGLQQANSNASQAYLQLRNNGAGVAPVYSLEIAGPGSNAFWIGQSSCYGANLNPNEACSVQVNFNPSDATAYDAQLRAGSEGGTSFTAGLSGEGGRAKIGPAFDPTSFGAVPVGSGGVTKAIEITNRGNYPGGAFIAVIAGGAVGSYHLLDEDCTGIPLSPEASCTVLINFDPLSTGVKIARLGLFGDSDGGAQVTLTGIGTEPEEAEDAGEPVSAAAAPELRRKRHLGPHRHRGAHRRSRRGVANLRPSR
jgi:hypothetical protein